MNRFATGRLAALLILTGAAAAQDVALHVFQASPQRARLVHVATGRVFGLVEGTAELKEGRHHLQLSGWFIDSRMSKSPMKVFDAKIPLTTMSRIRFEARFVGDVEGACERGEVRVESSRMQWFKEPYLESLRKSCEAIAAARAKGDDYLVDKELFEARKVQLGVAEQEVALVLEAEWDRQRGPWVERWSVVNRVGFDQKPFAEETRFLELRVAPAAGSLPARLHAFAGEDQVIRAFPSPPQPWGKDLLKGFETVDFTLPTGYVVTPRNPGAEYALSGSWTAASRFVRKQGGLVLPEPLPFAPATEPLPLGREQAAFFDAVSRWSLPRGFGP